MADAHLFRVAEAGCRALAVGVGTGAARVRFRCVSENFKLVARLRRALDRGCLEGFGCFYFVAEA
jgi:hypothetical protein